MSFLLLIKYAKSFSNDLFTAIVAVEVARDAGQVEADAAAHGV